NINTTVASVPNTTTFIVSGGADPGPATKLGFMDLGRTVAGTATVSGRSIGISAATFATGALTFTTVGANALKVGDIVTTSGNAPAGWNKTNVAVTAIVSPTQFKVAATTDPGAITTKGLVLPNEQNVVTAATPAAKPGLLSTPEITITLH